MLAPGRGLSADADIRWRPVPDPATGALQVDPEFSLPTTAGPLNWQLWYDRHHEQGGNVGYDWGYGWRASFPLRLAKVDFS